MLPVLRIGVGKEPCKGWSECDTAAAASVGAAAAAAETCDLIAR